MRRRPIDTYENSIRVIKLVMKLTVKILGVRMDIIRVNDPSAGSPTETLLRLLLPLGDKVH